MTAGGFFGKTGRKLAIAAAILAAIGLTTVPRPGRCRWDRPWRCRSGLGSEPSRLAPCSRTPTTITRIITRMATTAITHPPRRTIRRRRITRPHGAAGTPITVPTTLVEYRARNQRWRLPVATLDGASTLASEVGLLLRQPLTLAAA